MGMGAGGVTADRYYVKRPTGKVFGPFDRNAIQMMLKSNKLGLDAEVSTDKEQWQSLAEIPEFVQAAGGDLPRSSGGGVSDLPRSSGAGFSDLPRPSGVSDLPRSSGGGVSDLPRSSGAGLSDLPRPSGGGFSDLPRPSGGLSDLPRPSGGGVSDLPRPSGGGFSDLPRPSGGGFSDLPRPSPGATALPTPAVLPPSISQAASADLRTSAELGEEDLFGGPMNTAHDRDDLFGAPAARPAAPPAPRPTQAASRPVAAMSEALDEDDLFGAPKAPAARAAQDDDDDLFGAPKAPAARASQDDDLFGPPPTRGQTIKAAPAPAPTTSGWQGPSASEMEDDDLFGGPPSPRGGASAPSEDDLFGGPAPQAPQAPKLGRGPKGPTSDDLFGSDGDDDDFLGGDKGFSFLDEAPEARSLASEDKAWEAGVLGGDEQSEAEWNNNLLTGSMNPEAVGMGTARAAADSPTFGGPAAPQAPARVNVSLDDDAPQAGDPFRPASTGIRAPAPEVLKESAGEQQKRSAMAMVGVPIVLILVVGGLAFGAYKFMGGADQEVVKVAPVKAFAVDMKALQTANHGQLRDLLAEAKKASPQGDLAAQVLLAKALLLSRYAEEDVAKDAQTQAEALRGAAAQGGINAVAVGAWEAVRGDMGKARELLEPLTGDAEYGYWANLFLGTGEVLRLEKTGVLKLQPNKDKGKGKDKDKDTSAEPKAPGEEVLVEAPKDGAPAEVAPADGGAPLDPMTEAAQAVSWLEAASKRDVTLPQLWLGRLYEQAGEDDRAIKAFQTSLGSAEEFVASHVGLGRAVYARGDLNEATKYLERVNQDLVAFASPAEKAEALYIMGRVYSARSQSDQAIESFTKALALDTSRTDMLRALAEEYERAQKYKEALNFFTTNQNLGQKDPDVMLGIVRAYMGLKQWPQAIAQLEVGEKQFPTDARFPYYLGQLNLKRGTFFDAQKALERAVEIDPKLLLAHATLAQLAWRTEKDAARGQDYVKKVVAYPELIDARVATEVAEFYRMAELRELSARWYKSAIDRDPNYWPARLALSKLLLEQGETDRALKLLERSRKEGVTDIRLSAYLADAYRQSGLYDQAVDEINRVIEKFPKNEEYIFIRGRIYFDRGNYDTALEDFNKAYELNPRFHEAYFYVGRTSLAQENTAQALKIFRHVLDYQPNNGEFRFYMGRALETEGRQSQALEEYRKATETDPGYGVRNPEIYVRRGRLLSRLGYTSDGKKDILRALELNPEQTDALVAMGEADFVDKNYDSAVKNLTRALGKNPEYPDAQFQLGMSYLYLKDNKSGAIHLQQAIRYGYKDPEVYRTLGYVYKELGQSAAALKSFRTFWEETKDKKIPTATQKEILNQIKELGG
jgi:tetratricopeptide (TPR) repeat protein